jgi:predicted methyltransferase
MEKRIGRAATTVTGVSVRLTERAHRLVAARLRSGDVAVDATVGNGYDTVFLAAAVGSLGKVYGFDLQPAALAAARERLESGGLVSRVVLIEAGHEEMAGRLPPEVAGGVAAVMFNLGYLPGSDRAVVTVPATTGPAVRSAVGLLRPGGIVSVLVYTGHPGGEAELELLRHESDRWRREGLDVVVERRDAPRAPVLFAAIKVGRKEA